MQQSQRGENRKKIWFQKSKNLFSGFYRTNNEDSNGTHINNKYTSTSRLGTSVWVFKKTLENNENLILSFKNLTEGAEFKYMLSNNSLNTSNEIANEMVWNSNDITNNISIKNTSNKRFLYIDFRVGLNQSSASVEDIMLEHNSVATTYEQYAEDKIFILNNNDVYEEFKKTEYLEANTGQEYETR